MNGLLYGLLGGVAAGGEAGAVMLKEKAKEQRAKAYENEKWTRQVEYDKDRRAEERLHQKGIRTEDREYAAKLLNEERRHQRGLLLEERTWREEQDPNNREHVPIWFNYHGTLTDDRYRGEGESVGYWDPANKKPVFYDIPGKTKGRTGGAGGIEEGGSDLYVIDNLGSSKKVTFGENDKGEQVYLISDMEGNITRKKIGHGSAESKEAGRQYAEDRLDDVGGWFDDISNEEMMRQYNVKTMSQLRHALELEGERDYLIMEELMKEGYTLPSQNGITTTGQPIQPGGQLQAPEDGSAIFEIGQDYFEFIRDGGDPYELLKEGRMVKWGNETITGKQAYQRIMGTGGEQEKPDDARLGELGQVKNKNGSISTEYSVTVDIPELGGWVNIPTMVKGQTDLSFLETGKLTEENYIIAIDRAIERVENGAILPSYKTLNEAILGAESRTEAEKTEPYQNQDKAGLASALNGGEAVPGDNVYSILSEFDTGKRKYNSQVKERETHEQRQMGKLINENPLPEIGKQISSGAEAITNTFTFNRYYNSRIPIPQAVIEQALPYLEGEKLQVAQAMLARYRQGLIPQ